MRLSQVRTLLVDEVASHASNPKWLLRCWQKAAQVALFLKMLDGKKKEYNVKLNRDVYYDDMLVVRFENFYLVYSFAEYKARRFSG